MDTVMKTKGADEKFCMECGAIIRARAEICPHCGVRQLTAPSGSAKPAAQPEHSKFVAAMLAIFLGGLGVHKFYLGKTGWGIIYLLLCWTFIPVLIGFLEGLNFLLMSEEVFQKRYGAP